MGKVNTQVSARLDEQTFHKASKTAAELHLTMADLVRVSIKTYLQMRDAYKAQKAKNLLNDVDPEGLV